MIYHCWLRSLPVDEMGRVPDQTRKNFDFELEVGRWVTPLSLRRDGKPRVTEDGLTVPDWWTDDETESQQQLAAMGMG